MSSPPAVLSHAAHAPVWRLNTASCFLMVLGVVGDLAPGIRGDYEVELGAGLPLLVTASSFPTFQGIELCLFLKPFHQALISSWILPPFVLLSEWEVPLN
jgi:hypothetical protein